MANHNTPTSGLRILLSLAALMIIIAGMKEAASILTPFFLSIFIAVISWPPLSWMSRKGVPDGIAILLVLVVVVLFLLLVSVYVGSSIKDFSTNLPQYQQNLRSQTAGLFDWMQQHGAPIEFEEKLIKPLSPGKVMAYAATLLSGFSSIFTDLFVILLTVIFILFESFSFPVKLRNAFGSNNADRHLADILNSIKQYMGIKALTSFVTGIIVIIGLKLLNISYPILWGLLAFLLNFIPNIGSIIAAIPAVLLALVEAGFGTAMLVAGLYITINILVGSVWEPKIMGTGLGLSTLVVFLSLIFWGWVFGAIGMLLSVPFTIIAKIVLENNPNTRWIAILLGQEPEIDQ